MTQFAVEAISRSDLTLASFHVTRVKSNKDMGCVVLECWSCIPD